MKLFGLLVLLFVTQTSSYRMPLPYGNGFPATSGNFWSEKTQRNSGDKKTMVPKIEPTESEHLKNLADTLNQALDAIDKMQIYNTRPLMKGLEMKLRKNASLMKTLLEKTRAEKKRPQNGHKFTRNRL